MKNILEKYAIPQLFITIKTTCAATPQVQIGTTMPTQIGLIYGLSVTCAGTDDQGGTLITYAQTALLYLNLKRGSTNAIEALRLDKLVFANGNLNTVFPASSERYLPMILPNTLSLDQSSYSNATSIASGVIMLDLWFLSNEMVDYLANKGAIDMDAVLLNNR